MTHTDGHSGVAVAKAAIAASEFVLTSFVPGGAFIALGMVALEYTYGDYLYQYIDPSYNTELK